MIRLFIGFDLPAATRDTLHRLCAGISAARWVPAENLHITLRFIGEVDFNTADALAAKLSDLQHPPVDIAFQGIGLAGSGHQARTLWVDVAPDPALTALQKRLEHLCRTAGCTPVPRRFHPHVTLARLSHPAPCQIQAFIDTCGPQTCPGFSADAISLFSSRLSPHGSRYTEELRVMLGSGPD